jgi:hypothetical protein
VRNTLAQEDNKGHRTIIRILAKCKDPMTGQALGQDDLQENATMLLYHLSFQIFDRSSGAGSETTAGTLTFAMFFLLQHPERLKKLCHEVRTSFSRFEEITNNSVAGLPYLDSVVNESKNVY